MSIDDTKEIAEVLRGYEAWRRTKAASVSDNMLSVSAYLDDYAKLRAMGAVQALQEAWDDAEREFEPFGRRAAEILGLPKWGEK